MALTYLEHIKVTWGGVLGLGGDSTSEGVQEIWTNGVRFWSPTGVVPTPTELQAMANNMLAPLNTWFTNTFSSISPTAGLSWVKCVFITNTGRQRDTDTATAMQTPVPGNGGFATPIWEQTYAHTLRTAVARGRGHSGRIYPPLNGSQPDSGSPYMPVNLATTMAASFATCLGSLRSTIIGQIVSGAGDFKPAVMSTGNTDGGGRAPLATVITGVVVDRVADIQHRRTNAVPRSEGTLAAV